MSNVNPVPMKPYPPGPPPQSSSNSTTIVVIILAIVGGILLLIVGCIIAVVFSMSAALAPAVSNARDAAQAVQSKNNLKQIGLAVHSYHDMHRQLPRAYLSGDGGKPRLSWRVAILPFLEQAFLYNQIDTSQLWNEFPNSRFNSQPVGAYHSPLDAAAPTQTSYLAIAGPGAVFSIDADLSLRNITDGSSNTICVIEVQDSGINWMEPRDLTIDEAVAAIKSSPTEKVNVLLLDGSVRLIDREMPTAALRGMMTIDGREPPPSNY